MKKKLELSIEWRTNEYYDMDTITLLLVEEKIAAIEKAQTILEKNPDFDSIRVMIDENCISSDSTMHRLGYGFVLVRAGDELYFIGTDHYDSANQVETEGFVLKPSFTPADVENFIDDWGQTDDEICAELGYDPDDDGSWEMIIGDGYFWSTQNKKWFPKTSSLYNEMDQEIANKLRDIG